MENIFLIKHVTYKILYNYLFLKNPTSFQYFPAVITCDISISISLSKTKYRS